MGEAVHTLSIIIPAYNEEKTIAELLQRVLDVDLGTGIERELIVVNDCSTDSTEQIVEDLLPTMPTLLSFTWSTKGIMGKAWPYARAYEP